jgi:hypothetical protein
MHTDQYFTAPRSASDGLGGKAGFSMRGLISGVGVGVMSGAGGAARVGTARSNASREKSSKVRKLRNRDCKYRSDGYG